MAEVLRKKKLIRNGHSTHVKKLVAETKNYLEHESGDQNKLCALRRSLEEKREVIKVLDEEILQEIEEEDEISKEVSN